MLDIIIRPLAGRLRNRLGNGATRAAAGSALFALALLVSLLPALWAIVASLAGVCLGLFAVHALAAGALNRRLSGSQGWVNSLYVLFYYLGGTAGINLSGQAWGGSTRPSHAGLAPGRGGGCGRCASSASSTELVLQARLDRQGVDG